MTKWIERYRQQAQERYDRLARVKAQYDPDNFFRSNNAAIAPIGAAAPHKQ